MLDDELEFNIVTNSRNKRLYILEAIGIFSIPLQVGLQKSKQITVTQTNRD